jgi:hypothetical protein
MSNIDNSLWLRIDLLVSGFREDVSVPLDSGSERDASSTATDSDGSEGTEVEENEFFEGYEDSEAAGEQPVKKHVAFRDVPETLGRDRAPSIGGEFFGVADDPRIRRMSLEEVMDQQKLEKFFEEYVPSTVVDVPAGTRYEQVVGNP